LGRSSDQVDANATEDKLVGQVWELLARF
jgi:hypothetical protein